MRSAGGPELAVSAAAAAVSSREFLGHPRGLVTLFLTEMWERFSYYGTRALLILFMTAGAAKGGLALDAPHAGAIYGLYTAGVYLFSLPGGWVADRLLGQRRSVVWGGALISAGNLTLAVPGAPQLCYLGLLVIALGTGLLKPNVSCIVGELYRSSSNSRRDAGFSIFYLGINLGSLLAPLVAGTVGETVGYRWGFLVSSIAMALGLVQYRATAHWLEGAGREFHRDGSRARRSSWWMLIAGLLVVGVAAAGAATGLVRVDVLQIARSAGLIMLILALAFFFSVASFGGLATAEKKRVAVIALLVVCSALFWAGYEQAGSTLNLFARDYTDRSLFGSLFTAGQHPASWYQAIPPIFVLILAPLFAWTWVTLGKHSLDPSAPTKFGFGILLLGLGFVVMMGAAALVASTGQKVLPIWLVLTYLMFTTGELCLSPIGLSSVTQLAPPRYVGQMMGMLFVGSALGNLTAGVIGGAVGGGSVLDMPGAFLRMALIAGGAGIAMLLAAPRVRNWLGNRAADASANL